MACRHRRSHRPRVYLQTLERRLAPAIFTVTNVADGGLGSLRQAILDANASVNVPDTINFQAGVTGTIPLLSPLAITDSVTINGPGAAVVTVSGQNAVQVLNIANAGSVINVALAELTVTAGRKVGGFGGGGIGIADEAVTLDGVVVSNNSSTGAGGGIGVAGGGRLTVRNSTVSGNAAINSGAGVYFNNGGSLLLENSTVSGNTVTGVSSRGGGVYFFGTVAAGGFTLRNSTLVGNTAPSGGGVGLLAVNTAAAPVLIQNSTITGNTSTTTATTAGFGGGGIDLGDNFSPTVTIVSSIVSGNAANPANGRSDIAIPTTATVNVNFSAVGDADGFSPSGTSGNNLPFGAALGLGTLGNNGGPTQTIAFESTGPLRDAGSNPVPLTTDQRGAGFARVAGPAADIGAFELQSAAAAPRVASVAVNVGQGDTTQRSRVTSLTVTFDAQVAFAGAVANAFTVSRIGGGAVGDFTATAAVVNGATVVTLSGFAGTETQFGSLADGRYGVLVRANQVMAGGQPLDGDGNGTGGDDFTLNGTTANGLFRLFGDANADGVINAFDFGQFRPAFGTSTGNPAYLDFLDFDGDGTINAFDFAQFRTRFGSSVP